MGMVSECCCKEVYIYIIDILIIIITFPYSTFFCSIIPIFLFILKCFFVLVIIISHECKRSYSSSKYGWQFWRVGGIYGCG